MNDYLNSIKHHDNEDAWSKNGHEQNYNIVLTLLTEHEGLVRNYLSKPQLEKPLNFDPFGQVEFAPLALM